MLKKPHQRFNSPCWVQGSIIDKTLLANMNGILRMAQNKNCQGVIDRSQPFLGHTYGRCGSSDNLTPSRHPTDVPFKVPYMLRINRSLLTGTAVREQFLNRLVNLLARQIVDPARLIRVGNTLVHECPMCDLG
jgi:hypothetical protein